MENTEFKRLYKKLIEYHGLSVPKAREIQRCILLRLQKDKEKKE